MYQTKLKLQFVINEKKTKRLQCSLLQLFLEGSQG